MAKNIIDLIAGILLIIGGLNWGLMGLKVGNVVEMIIGATIVTDIIYILVGISALYMIYGLATK